MTDKELADMARELARSLEDVLNKLEQRGVMVLLDVYYSQPRIAGDWEPGKHIPSLLSLTLDISRKEPL